MLSHKTGVLSAITAYFIWGITPLFFKQLSMISPDGILIHRILWSFLFMCLLVFFTEGFRSIFNVLKRPRQILVLIITSLLISVNWLVYVWAINTNHLLDASLGYFINPIVNIMLGVIFLKERLRFMQKIAVFLVCIGIGVQIIEFRSIPIISLVLAFSFAFYGLLRKKVDVNASIGLLIETMILLPITLIYFFMFYKSTSLFTTSTITNIYLLVIGIVTTVPLILFAAASRVVTLTLLGFFQYISPSILFLFAIFLYKEPLVTSKIITFILIWGALGLFLFDMYASRIKGKLPSKVKTVA